MIIDQGKAIKLSRLYIQNRSEEGRNTFGNLYICMGNDPSHPTAPGNICLLVPIYEGGFINVESLPAARYVFLYRKDFTGVFNLSSARAFQAPNLLEQPDVTIIADYTSVNANL